MTQEEYNEEVLEFLDTCDLVRLYTYKETGYEWMVVPQSGANRTMKEQHKLYMRNKNGIDDDGDGNDAEGDTLPQLNILNGNLVVVFVFPDWRTGMLSFL